MQRCHIATRNYHNFPPLVASSLLHVETLKTKGESRCRFFRRLVFFHIRVTFCFVLSNGENPHLLGWEEGECNNKEGHVVLHASGKCTMHHARFIRAWLGDNVHAKSTRQSQMWPLRPLCLLSLLVKSNHIKGGWILSILAFATCWAKLREEIF